MIKNRKMGHIGLATNDVETTVKWYVDVLGYEVIGKFPFDGRNVYFIKNTDGVIYEMFQPASPLPEAAVGKIDHYCFESQDVEADYKYCLEQGYPITTNGIEEFDFFNGCRIFKIASPTGEEIEFAQML